MPKFQRDPARERFWRQTLADWRASGRTIPQFCHERQLSRTAFDHWQRELKRRDQALTKTTTKTTPPAKPTKPTTWRPAKTPAFVPVTVVPSANFTNITPAVVEVHCPTGHIVRLPAADMTTLRELFTALATTEVTSC